VLEEAVNDALPKFYAQAVEESAVRPLGQPQVDVTEVPDPASTDGELKFTAEVDVRPELQLPELQGIEVVVDDLAITDEDVDARLEELRERFGTLLPADRAAVDGDFVSIALRATIGDEEIDAANNISYQIGSGTMLDGLDGALIGLSADEETTFESELAGGEHKGENALVEVTLEAVKDRQLPELDDDFAQLASEFDSLEELRADLRGQTERAKRVEQGLQARDRLLAGLLEAVEVPIPEGIVADEVHRHLEGEGRLEDEEHRAEVDTQTREALRNQLLLDAVAEVVGAQVTQPELVEFIVTSAQQYGMEPNAFAQAMDQAGQVPGMVAELTRRKALAAVLSRAVVKDASGNPVDLSAVFGSPDAENPAYDIASDDPAAVPTLSPISGADPAALPILTTPLGSDTHDHSHEGPHDHEH
jgi:trigger factor